MATVKRKTELFNTPQLNGETRKPNSRMLLGQNRRDEERSEREKIVLWRRPIQTLTYFSRELRHNVNTFAARALQYRISVILATVLLVSLYVLLHLSGPHQNVSLTKIQNILYICLYLKFFWKHENCRWCIFWDALITKNICFSIFY